MKRRRWGKVIYHSAFRLSKIRSNSLRGRLHTFFIAFRKRTGLFRAKVDPSSAPRPGNSRVIPVDLDEQRLEDAHALIDGLEFCVIPRFIIGRHAGIPSSI